MIGVSTFIANMFILAIAAALWLLVFAGFLLIVMQIAEKIKEIR